MMVDPNMGPSPNLCWYTRLTPEGPAGVSVWKIQGPSSWELIQSVFVDIQGRILASPPVPGGQCLGYLKGKDLIADEMLLVNRSNAVLTAFELQAHGGPILSNIQEKILQEAGFEKRQEEDGCLAEWPEAPWLVRHLYRTLLETSTTRGVRGLLQQARVLPQAFREIFLAFQMKQPDRVQSLVADLLTYSSLAMHWTRPFLVTLLGPPNVGKSSLLNALVGNQRAVVSDIPGTTLDLVQARIAIQGWLFELCDTAGMREQGAGQLEEMGIQLAKNIAADADLNLWLVDPANAPNPPDFQSEEIAANLGSYLVIHTKADLTCSPAFGEAAGEEIWVSSKTGLGLDTLQATLVNRLTKGMDSITRPTACTPELVAECKDFAALARAGRFQEGLKRVECWL